MSEALRELDQSLMAQSADETAETRKYKLGTSEAPETSPVRSEQTEALEWVIPSSFDLLLHQQDPQWHIIAHSLNEDDA